MRANDTVPIFIDVGDRHALRRGLSRELVVGGALAALFLGWG